MHSALKNVEKHLARPRKVFAKQFNKKDLWLHLMK